MKKIIILIPNMNLGGTEKAMLSMLHAIDRKNYEITVAVIEKSGSLLKEISADCHLTELPLSPETRAELMRGGVKKNILSALKKLNLVRAFSIYRKAKNGDMLPYLSTEFGKILRIEGFYDYAICYQTHNPFVLKYVAEKITASKKYAFVHNDFATTGYLIENLIDDLNRYDKIYTVSQQIKDELCARLPQVKNRVEVLYNAVDVEQIMVRSQLKTALFTEGDALKLVSVGRLDEQKGFDLAIRAGAILQNKGVNFRWVIIGEGKLRKVLEKQIRRLKLKDKMIFTGALENPYPHIRNCDIYVQTSRHEGYCTATNEAKILRKPVVTTKVSGAEEQFRNLENGIVCNISAEAIANAVALLAQNEELCEKFIANLTEIDRSAEDNRFNVLFGENESEVENDRYAVKNSYLNLQ